MSEQRAAAIRGLLQEQKLGAALLCNPGRNGVGHWLTETEQVPVLPPFQRNSMLILYESGEVRRVSALQPHPTDPEQYPLFQPQLLEGYLGDGVLGVINGDCLKASVLTRIQDAFGEIRLIELTDAVSRLQAEKSPGELEQMTRAAKRYDRLFSAMPLILQQEKLEQSAVVDIRYRGLQLGMEAEDLGLLTQVWLTSAPEQSEWKDGPILWPGRRLTWGDRINVQVAGLTPEGVHAALGRCYVMGPASPETRRGWEITLSIQDAAAASLKPGAHLRQAAQRAEELAQARGVTLKAGLWLHGVGCGWQEYPRNIDASAELPLEENMTILVAPAVLSGQEAPYCCMDVYRVTPEGGVRLSGTPRTLVELE